jgi:hypothetical protein
VIRLSQDISVELDVRQSLSELQVRPFAIPESAATPIFFSVLQMGRQYRNGSNPAVHDRPTVCAALAVDVYHIRQRMSSVVLCYAENERVASELPGFYKGS